MLCSQPTHKSTTSVTKPNLIAIVRDEYTFCLTLIIPMPSVTGSNLKPVPEGMDGNPLDLCSCITCFAPIQWYKLATDFTIVTLFNTPIYISYIPSIKQPQQC